MEAKSSHSRFRDDLLSFEANVTSYNYKVIPNEILVWKHSTDFKKNTNIL